MRGEAWSTPKQLNCRSLDVTVGRASIDLAGLATQRILLRQPALGQAAIVFNQRDWGRFLVHPLMADALRRFAAAYLPPPSPPPSPSPPSPPPAVRFHQAGASFAPDAVRFGLDYNGAPPKPSQGTLRVHITHTHGYSPGGSTATAWNA